MSVSRTVSEILSVKYWRDIEIRVWGRSRSFKKIRLRPPQMSGQVYATGSMLERLRGFTTRRCIHPLYLYLTLPILLQQ